MNYSYNDKYDFYGNARDIKPKRQPIPKGCHEISEAKPKTGYYHYSNENSQGALVCETRSFPSFFNPETQDYHSAYSDRLAGWDYDNFEKVCEFVGTGDQGWCYRLSSFTDDKLKEFAQLALKLDKLPKHVRIVHHYSVSNGYSCPTIEAITDKEKPVSPPESK